MWSGNLSRFSETQTLLLAHEWYTGVWNRWIRFYQSLREINQILFRVETHEVGIYQDGVRHRHYYQLTDCILESEFDEFGFYLSWREVNGILVVESNIYEADIYQDSVKHRQ